MQHCYLCGVGIPGDGYRREVETGSSRWSSVGWSRRGSYRTGSGTRYGLRTLCASCAEEVDRRNRNSAIATSVFVCLMFIGGLWACSAINSETPKAAEPVAPSIPETAVPVAPRAPFAPVIPSRDNLPRCSATITDRCWSG